MFRNRQPRVERQRKDAAFTLLEVLVALGLSLVVVGAIATFQSYQLRTLRGQAKQIDLQSTARSVVDLVAREVRTTGKNPQCKDAVGGLVTATKKTLQILTDLDGDGTISAVNENVSYVLDASSGSVFRNDPKQTGTDNDKLIDGVDIEGSGFSYFDGNGAALDAGGTGLDVSQRRQVRRVRFDLEMADTTAGESAAHRVRASTSLDLRNRFFVANNALCTPTRAPQPTQPHGGTPTVGPTQPASTPTAGAPTATPHTGTPLPTPTQPSVATPTPCLGYNAACSDDAQCCSGVCKNKATCGR